MTSCSPGLAEIFGVSVDEYLERSSNSDNDRAWYHPDDREDYRKAVETAKKNKTGYDITSRIFSGQNEVRWIHQISDVTLNDDGSLRETFGVALDITEQKKVEREIIVAREAADHANRAKSDFLSSMSHELRTPMNAILGFAQMLEYNPKEPLTETQKSSVAHIKTGGDHLLRLIEDILDLAKVEAGKTEFSIEDISVSACINECLSLLQTMSEDRGIDISFARQPDHAYLIRADFTRLRQVILNLVSNAIKYNSENGRIAIELVDIPNDFLRISISDTGIGIPQNRYKELFKPFSRLGAENTEIEGTGIGLVVTKELVELMGGSIGFTSEVGRGSTFYINLPLASDTVSTGQKDAVIESTVKIEPSPSVCGTVLYVEDNPANLALMEQVIVQIEGVEMISAHNAEFGLELAKARNPDLIILDINLPGMSGLEALGKLKDMEEVSSIPVIALSAAATKKDIQKGHDAGFQHYLIKPINVAHVTEVIREILMSSGR